jgi:hypothetical protein
MQPLTATLVLYLLIAFQVAREYPSDTRPRDGVGEIAVAIAVLITGLLWPVVFWKAMRRDPDNR